MEIRTVIGGKTFLFIKSLVHDEVCNNVSIHHQIDNSK